jgi:hypothetical protein
MKYIGLQTKCFYSQVHVSEHTPSRLLGVYQLQGPFYTRNLHAAQTNYRFPNSRYTKYNLNTMKNRIIHNHHCNYI